MAEQARQVIVLTESEKFLCRGVERTVQTEQVSQVFTDDLIPADKEAFLQSRNTAVHKVPSALPSALPSAGGAASHLRVISPAHTAPIVIPAS
jgi:hypothetical protein